MNEIKIDRLDIKKYKKKVAKAAKRKFDEEKTQIVGLVSPINHEMAYYGTYNIHRFILSVWQKGENDELSEQEVIIYRIVHDETKDCDLNIVPLLSFVNLNVYLDKKHQRAIFCDGHVLNDSPNELLQKIQDALEPAQSIFGSIECVYKNNYESESVWNGKTVKSTFNKSKKESVMTFFLKTLKVVHPLEIFNQNLEKHAINELLELKQKGWFKDKSNADNYADNEFLKAFRAENIDGLIFEKRRFSIWYGATSLFDGSRIIFNGDYENGITKVRLNGDAGSDKEYLLNKNRNYINTDSFGKLEIDSSGGECTKRIPWLDSYASLTFEIEESEINPDEMKIAEAIFKNQQTWNDKAYDYTVKHFHQLKNESWREDDEALMSVEEFKKLLGEFTLSFSEYDPYDFSFNFDTDDKLFAGHGIIIGGSLEDGFTDNELFG